MEDVFQLALVVAIAAVLLVAGLFYLEYIDGLPVNGFS